MADRLAAILSLIGDAILDAAASEYETQSNFYRVPHKGKVISR